MILEMVRWQIKADQGSAFERAFKEAEHYLEEATGYQSHKLLNCMESPNRYSLLVEWDSLEDHTVGFQKSNSYQDYRNLIRPFFEPGTTMEHYASVT